MFNEFLNNYLVFPNIDFGKKMNFFKQIFYNAEKGFQFMKKNKSNSISIYMINFI